MVMVSWFLTPVWVISGFESSSTLAEEASNAYTVVPFSMVSSLLASLFVGTGIIITLISTMGTDIKSLLQSQLGQPVGQIFYNSLGQRGAVAIFFLMFLGFVFNCTNLVFAASRQMFAFARDGGFPLSTYMSEERTHCTVCVKKSKKINFMIMETRAARRAKSRVGEGE